MELIVEPDKAKEMEPIQLGEAAAHGKRLLECDEWIRVDSSGAAELVEVPLKSQCISTLISQSSQGQIFHRHSGCAISSALLKP